MNKRFARRAAGLLGAVTASLAIAGPAAAYNWGALTAGSDAEGRGTFYNNGGIQSENSSYQYQLENGDSGAFVSTDYYYYGPNSYCGGNQNGSYNVCWYEDHNWQTGRTTSHSWVWGASYDQLKPDASAARGSIKVCEDISWWPDTCSASVIKSFNY